MLRVYFGHHKCASQYIKAIFLNATALLGMTPSRVDNFSAELPLGYHTRAPFMASLQEHRERLLTDPAVVWCLTNGDNEAVALLEQRGAYRGFHVIRDPRDVLVSAYFSHRYSHPIRAEGSWIAEFRRQLNAAPDIEHGLLLELEFLSNVFAAMATWHYANPCVCEARYETLIADPVQEFARIFRTLEIRTPQLGLTTLAAIARDRRHTRRHGGSMPLRNDPADAVAAAHHRLQRL
ncbi:MAG: sulfotransferase domain-containing protein [Anaerolineales bacterium]|nr:sulfotransferase domain-containing protein [Anaerolineales bacterium]